MAKWDPDSIQVFFSTRAWGTVPGALKKPFRVLWSDDPSVQEDSIPCVYCFASEIVHGPNLPQSLKEADCRYCIILDDLPVQGILRIPSILNLHRPDQRAHLTRDAGAIARGVTALLRDRQLETVIDAYVLGTTLSLILVDLRKREVDLTSMKVFRGKNRKDLSNFVIDENGSYLHWPRFDIHLGVSQVLQAVEPEYLAEVEIERNALDYSGWAIAAWRHDLNLKQADIEGLSERQVGRIENGTSRLMPSSANHFARAFNVGPAEFFDQLAKRTRKVREAAEGATAGLEEEKRTVVLFDVAA